MSIITVKMICAEGKFSLMLSWVLLPGFYVASTGLLFVTYAIVLFYLFLGIAIVSDVFMG